MTDLKEARAAIAHELATQDNACTAEPIYLVQEEVRDVGMDPDYTEDIGWFHSEGEFVTEKRSPKRFARFEAGDFSGDDDGDADDWTRTGYRHRWEYVQTFITRKAAEEYIASNAHRHRRRALRIYVDSAHRNPEMRLIRKVMGEGTEE